MGVLTTRLADSKDTQILASLCQSCVSPKLREKINFAELPVSLAYHIDNNLMRCFVAEDGGQIKAAAAGSVTHCYWDMNKPFGVVLFWWSRHPLCGLRAFRALVADMKERGAAHIMCGAPNSRTGMLYEREGFSLFEANFLMEV